MSPSVCSVISRDGITYFVKQVCAEPLAYVAFVGNTPLHRDAGAMEHAMGFVARHLYAAETSKAMVMKAAGMAS
jgi:hypothetical protein